MSPTSSHDWKLYGFVSLAVGVLYLMSVPIMLMLGVVHVPADPSSYDVLRFTLSGGLALLVAMGTGFLGADAVASGRVTLPLLKEHPIAMSVGGGTAVFVIVFVLAITAFGRAVPPKEGVMEDDARTRATAAMEEIHFGTAAQAWHGALARPEDARDKLRVLDEHARVLVQLLEESDRADLGSETLAAGWQYAGRVATFDANVEWARQNPDPSLVVRQALLGIDYTNRSLEEARLSAPGRLSDIAGFMNSAQLQLALAHSLLGLARSDGGALGDADRSIVIEHLEQVDSQAISDHAGRPNPALCEVLTGIPAPPSFVSTLVQRC